MPPPGSTLSPRGRSVDSDAQDERFVAIDYRDLSREALVGLVEELITREGTDYGAREVSLESKVQDVLRQLASGEARIVFDAVEETANIVPAHPGKELEESSE